MIVSSKGVEPIEPTCPVHPEQELRIEFGKRGRTGFCLLCPMHYSVCEEWKGMWPCMKLHGHEGEHSGQSMIAEFEQAPGVRFSGVVGEMQAFTPRPERDAREIYELPAPAEHSTNLATGKRSSSCSATNVFVDLGEQFSPKEFADHMKSLGLLPEEATEAWISSYAVVRPPEDDVLVHEETITYTSRQPQPDLAVNETRVQWSLPANCAHGTGNEPVPPLPRCTMCGGTGRRSAGIIGLELAGVTGACRCTCSECRRLSSEADNG